MAIRRITTLFGWRSQLLNQVYLFDKIRRRPFMFAREPIAFVSVDAGSGVYVAGSSDEESTTAAGVSLPSDLRKRLAEIGWDDKVRPKDSRREKERTPLSILSLNQITEQSNLSKENIVKSENETSLLRRKSSSDSAHHSGHRRRSVFVPALVALFAGLSQLTTEPDPFVAGSAREAVHLMLRDDPSMICRPLMEDLSSNEIQIERVISTLRYLLHVHRSLPPSASHHMFGYLSGFLKHISREQYHSDGLQMFAYTVPVLATLVSQVYNLSVRDIRRTKMEIFVLPLGSMWFPSTAPDTPMFPRYLPVEQRGKGFPRQLEHICMIRTAQNLFLLDMLKYKSKELHIARRRLMDLKLPDDPIGSELKFSDFLPRRTAQPLRTQFQQVSLALSRTYLLLLSQIFRAMPRNFNSRSELKNLFGGLNRVLLAHGNDIGIIAHALIGAQFSLLSFITWRLIYFLVSLHDSHGPLQKACSGWRRFLYVYTQPCKSICGGPTTSWDPICDSVCVKSLLCGTRRELSIPKFGYCVQITRVIEQSRRQRLVCRSNVGIFFRVKDESTINVRCRRNIQYQQA